MTFPILGGNGAGAEQYLIDNSLRLNSSDSAFLKRTNSTAGNRQKWTFSTWVKLTEKKDGNVLIYPHGASNNLVNLAFGSGTIYMDIGSVGRMFQTNAVFRDVSAWYHIVVAFNTTDYSTVSAGQVRVYVNGVEQTFSTTTNMSVGFNSAMNDAVDVGIGRDEGADNNYADHYLAETYLIDGQQLSPTDFGEFDEDSGIWKPIEYTGSYGTNGFYLDFENSGSLGADQSGNGNNFTPTNLASTDQTTDTPTNNFATFNPLDNLNTPSFSEGNLKVGSSTGSHTQSTRSTFAVKYNFYFEFHRVDGGTQNFNVGVATTTANLSSQGNTGVYTKNYSGGAGDIVMFAYSASANALWTGLNGTWDNSASVAEIEAGTTTNATHTSILSEEISPVFIDSAGSFSGRIIANFGQDGSFAGTETAQGNLDENGYGDFYYAPPSGYLALCTQNLATELSPTIDDGSQYFNTVLYSGTGSENAITGVGFQPDWVWLKDRTQAYSHGLFDSSRGANKKLNSNNANAEETVTEQLKSFDSDGFTLGTANGVNQSSDNFVAWQWKANAGSTSSNTDGSITSTVQANTTAGFSVVTYTGTGSDATVGHGLGKEVAMVIQKRRSGIDDWSIYHKELGKDKYIILNSTNAEGSLSNFWGTSTPNSTVFGLLGGGYGHNKSGSTHIAYCFAPISGYSAMGKYTGNSSTDGTFVYTGFRPAFVIIKNTSTANAWNMFDNARDPFNFVDHKLFPNLSNAEQQASNNKIDFLSNGFKLREINNENNASGQTYIYMCFAENPFVSSTGIPVTAR